MTNVEYLKSHGWIHIKTNMFGSRKQFVWQHPRYGNREFVGTDFTLYTDAKMKDLPEDFK